VRIVALVLLRIIENVIVTRVRKIHLDPLQKGHRHDPKRCGRDYARLRFIPEITQLTGAGVKDHQSGGVVTLQVVHSLLHPEGWCHFTKDRIQPLV
jgi:hypothetical protein